MTDPPVPAATAVTHAVPLEPAGVLLFASALDEPRARRPTDVALAIVSSVLLIAAAVLSGVARDLDAAFSEFLATLPGVLEPVWLVLFWAPLVWALALIVIALLRGRTRLARDLVTGALASVLIALIVAAIVTDDAADVGRMFADVNGPPAFPPGALTIAAAIIATASPHLSRPFRHLGRWLVAGQMAASLCLGATRLTGAAAAIAVGLLAAALVHVAVGSPGGRPTTSRIVLALRGLGVPVGELAPASMHADGVLRFEGTDTDGNPLAVKVYGRDAWDGQLLASLWRNVWYRDTARTARLSRIELVEHEGFITLLAERAGVRVPPVVTAGSAGRGDALVVVRPDGVPLEAGMAVDEAGLRALWDDLARLHRAGITHRRLDIDRLVLRPDGSIGFGDLSSGSVTDTAADLKQDRAQALVLSIVLIGEDRAVALGREALGDAGLLDVVPYVQEAAMPQLVDSRLSDLDLELEGVRNRLAETLGGEEQPLIKLRRVTVGSLVNLALLAVAGYVMIGLLGDLDMDTFVDELGEASWWWLAFALILAQIPRLPAAISTMGAIERPLPLGPLVSLQFAISYVNLAVPSTAARVAINVRFFQRFGVPAATAMSAGAIDSVSGFIVQILIFLGMFLVTDLDLGLTLDTGDLSGLATVALIVLAVLVVVVVVVAFVPPLRRRVVSVAKQAGHALRVLKSPSKLLQLFGGNLISQVLFAVALSACVFGFGEDVSLGTLLLINTVVSLFAGLLPVPGGMGVSEAGITLGLTTAGVSSETAFAIALAYRFASFYLPPIWGWFCYRWLVQRRYL